MDDIVIDRQVRVRIEQILSHAEPYYPRDIGGTTSIHQLLAGGPPVGLFNGANDILATSIGINLKREKPQYWTVQDVCEKATTSLLINFILACCVHLSRVNSRATSIEPLHLVKKINTIFEQHNIPIRLEKGKALRLDKTYNSLPKVAEQKFEILLSPKEEEPYFESLTEEHNKLQIPIAVLFIDIDEFKGINEKYTETKVDQSILPEAQRLLRRPVVHRSYAYRHGGEEFVVILPNHDESDAFVYGERIRKAFESHSFIVDNHPEQITVSIGIAIWPLHGNDYAAILSAANSAEHYAKQRGRNQVCIANQV